MSLSLIDQRLLVTPRRLDVAVKWRYFRHLLTDNDPDAKDVYVWHIEKRSGHRMKAGLATDAWKKSIDDYLGAAKELLESIETVGIHTPIPVDPDGELLGGAHRLAAALALGMGQVPVFHSEQKVWAPAWDYKWFLISGMSAPELKRTVGDLNRLADA